MSERVERVEREIREANPHPKREGGRERRGKKEKEWSCMSI